MSSAFWFRSVLPVLKIVDVDCVEKFCCFTHLLVYFKFCLPAELLLSLLLTVGAFLTISRSLRPARSQTSPAWWPTILISCSPPFWPSIASGWRRYDSIHILMVSLIGYYMLSAVLFRGSTTLNFAWQLPCFRQYPDELFSNTHCSDPRYFEVDLLQ